MHFSFPCSYLENISKLRVPFLFHSLLIPALFCRRSLHIYSGVVIDQPCYFSDNPVLDNTQSWIFCLNSERLHFEIGILTGSLQFSNYDVSCTATFVFVRSQTPLFRVLKLVLILCCLFWAVRNKQSVVAYFMSLWNCCLVIKSDDFYEDV